MKSKIQDKRAKMASATHVGMIRDKNEDSFLTIPDPELLLVADGMGGHDFGEVASQMAVDTIQEFLALTHSDPDMTWPYAMDSSKKYDENRLMIAIKMANSFIYQAYQRGADSPGMGTTIVSLFVGNEKIHIAHVGDSRAYRIRHGSIEQLTEDHSLLNNYKRARTMTEEEIRAFPHKNVIVRALGIEENVEIDIRSEEPRENDLYLLCSDGLSDPVSSEEMLEIIQKYSNIDEIPKRLIERANEHGGPDNITAAVIQIALIT